MTKAEDIIQAVYDSLQTFVGMKTNRPTLDAVAATAHATLNQHIVGVESGDVWVEVGPEGALELRLSTRLEKRILELHNE